ncbi:hypothetical protein HMPREF1990_01715 [Porphyromonas gingivalis W4087]|nr:hypothetical protein A343_0582 [Porphyromonas gingivalis JCVI SC001]ERJ87685.1 hypothetical protein HMPREF1990_01715 [Porphyromonas gingivalis W4087]
MQRLKNDRAIALSDNKETFVALTIVNYSQGVRENSLAAVGRSFV